MTGPGASSCFSKELKSLSSSSFDCQTLGDISGKGKKGKKKEKNKAAAAGSDVTGLRVNDTVVVHHELCLTSCVNYI